MRGRTAGLMARELARELRHKLTWLMAARVAFTAILLTSTILTQFRINDPSRTGCLEVLYWFTGAVFLLSIVYAWISSHVRRSKLFGLVQMGVDALLVTLIVYITGGYHSLFVFLYLLVVICASVILGLRGGIAISVIGNLFYGAMLILQYTGGVPLFGMEESRTLHHLSWLTIIYRILNMAVASIAVAVLCGLLIEQTRKNRKKFQEMEEYVQRVEKMAHMGEIAAGLAHEIRNPLASLSGSIQLLSEDMPWNDDHQRLMKIVLRETDRLNKLVNDFLFFARPPAGTPQTFNLTDAVDDVCGLFERDTHFSGTRFALIKDLKPDLWVVMDPAHLRQVLWNLLVNAADAVAADGRIVIETIPRKNNEVQIRLSDDGCGIAPEALPSIFHPFFTTKAEGTGLGLSIVHRILEGYHSRLTVESHIAQGTTFSFLLKRAPSAPTPEAAMVARPDSGKRPFAGPSGRLSSSPPSAC